MKSRASASAAGATMLPHAELQVSGGDDQQSLLSSFGEVAKKVPGFRRNYRLVDVGAAASWETDLFGGLRRNREAARAELQATAEDRSALLQAAIEG